MGMTQYRNSVTRAEEAVLKENLFRMRDAIDQFYADKNKYPADLAALASEGYMREIPTDPDDEVEGHVDDDAGRAGCEQPGVAGGHLRREERFRPHRARRHALRGLVLTARL